MDPENFLLLTFGWLLGLLSPVIVDAIKRRHDNERGRAAIASELRELGTTLAIAAYSVRADQGTIDRSFLEWLKHDLETQATGDETQSFIPALRTQVGLPDDQLQSLVKQMATRPNKGTMLQRYAAPLLDSRVSALSSFDTSFQRQLLEIRQGLALLDDLVERSRKYFDLTFTKLDDPNPQLVRENLVQACAEYAKRAERIVKAIRRLPTP